MPFHKLSQWLTYSLLEPFAWAGSTSTGLDALTGLPEYRNGGLLLDTGVLRAAASRLARRGVDSRRRTGGRMARADGGAARRARGAGARAPRHRAAQLPLACVLEGGTWAAGRALAQRLRGGRPPLTIVSDGTVF